MGRDNNILVSVPEQQLMSCDPNTHGSNGGQVYKAFEYVIKNGGIASESDYPYEAINGTCNHQKEKRIALTIEGYGKVKSLCEPCLLCAVSRLPVSVYERDPLGLIHVSTNFFIKSLYFEHGHGLFDASSCPNVERWYTDHAMLIVGYGSLGLDHDYWIVKNSWGREWGDSSYIYIKTNTGDPFGVCNFNCYACYPTKNILKLDSAI
ncbi:cysteine protease XCP2-like [Prosopis cineraria]|uniref:cysteine protease XCP2-like n=1 Tax=Prosopis cineraria TaxID=364024 RepID=UPI00240F7DDC|nr:cysteine protease XCP2-like [Prosopis cineraria]XP_054778222.1 cysteine protease XCP2-like [Prosopis cineraria]